MRNRLKLCLLIIGMTHLVCILLCFYQSRNTSVSVSSSYGKNIEQRFSKADRSFDDMELYVRMTSSVPALSKLYKSVLVQSLRYFWPDVSSMVVVLDQENSKDHELGNRLRNIFPFPRICYMDNITVPGFSGKDRMQRDMFYPERCTSKKYVAFVDTDTMFISRIVREMLFTENKPIFIAIYGKELHTNWVNVAHTTAKLLKTKEVMRCMSNFPIVISVEHIVEARRYIETLHKMAFDQALIHMKTGQLSQFNVMCQYLWMFHRSEYEFHFQLQVIDTHLSSSYRVDPESINAVITEEQRRPIARVCMHYTKTQGWYKQEIYTHLFKSSICFAGGFEICPETCKLYSRSSLRVEMFKFGNVDWRWDGRCINAQEEHYNKLVKYANAEYSAVIRNACKEVDNLIWSESSIKRRYKYSKARIRPPDKRG